MHRDGPRVKPPIRARLAERREPSAACASESELVGRLAGRRSRGLQRPRRSRRTPRPRRHRRGEDPVAEFFTTENLIALLTLALLEVVLGIDNVVFLSILSGKLPPEQRAKARRVGLAAAMLMRVGLLFGVSWIARLTEPWFQLFGRGFSGRDLILLGGGLFLIGKATWEIHDKLEGEEHAHKGGGGASFRSVILQIMVLDIVFSLDSVITAVGMVKSVAVMIVAVMIAVGVMMVFANAVCDFVERHPTIKMLALSFLILIGVMLVAEGMGKHIEKGYVYFAMAFSLAVEFLNMRLRRAVRPVHLRHTHIEPDAPESHRPKPS
jgi:predicted tellurium resistance membrane protein TerC